MHRAARWCLPVIVAAFGLCNSGCNTLNVETDDGRTVKRWSDEWYDSTSTRAVGARQKKRHGLMWPPYPRPAGESMEYSHKFHVAHYWPHPYNCQDRDFVNDLAARQVNAGWVAQTTLYDYHFDEDTNELNKAGRLQLQWILQGAPAEHRHVSVQTDDSQAGSRQRLEAVRAESVAIAGATSVPPISLRTTDPLSRPALEVDIIQRRVLESMPDPRITYTALPTGASDGGG